MFPKGRKVSVRGILPRGDLLCNRPEAWLKTGSPRPAFLHGGGSVRFARSGYFGTKRRENKGYNNEHMETERIPRAFLLLL